MTREEYDAKRMEIFHQLTELKEQYIRENTDIEPGSKVMAAGQVCYLKEYKVINSQIYPVLFRTKSYRYRIHVSAHAKITKI